MNSWVDHAEKIHRYWKLDCLGNDEILSRFEQQEKFIALSVINELRKMAQTWPNSGRAVVYCVLEFAEDRVLRGYTRRKITAAVLKDSRDLFLNEGRRFLFGNFDQIGLPQLPLYTTELDEVGVKAELLQGFKKEMTLAMRGMIEHMRHGFNPTVGIQIMQQELNAILVKFHTAMSHWILPDANKYGNNLALLVTEHGPPPSFEVNEEVGGCVLGAGKNDEPTRLQLPQELFATAQGGYPSVKGGGPFKIDKSSKLESQNMLKSNIKALGPSTSTYSSVGLPNDSHLRSSGSGGQEEGTPGAIKDHVDLGGDDNED